VVDVTDLASSQQHASQTIAGDCCTKRGCRAAWNTPLRGLHPIRHQAHVEGDGYRRTAVRRFLTGRRRGAPTGLGRSRPAVSSVEAGTRRITVADAVALCGAHKISLRELLEGADPEDLWALGLQSSRCGLRRWESLWESSPGYWSHLESTAGQLK
jgi:hypothetical protein